MAPPAAPAGRVTVMVLGKSRYKGIGPIAINNAAVYSTASGCSANDHERKLLGPFRNVRAHHIDAPLALGG